MSHVPPLTAKSVHPSSADSLTVSDSVDVHSREQSCDNSPATNDTNFDEPSKYDQVSLCIFHCVDLWFLSIVVTDSYFVNFASVFCRNKRKNFKPRCFVDESDSETATLERKKESVIATSTELSDKSDQLQICSSISADSSPNMADSILNELVSSINKQAFAPNGKLDQPLDLSQQDQLQRNKQLAEFLFLKNLPSMFYPQLSHLAPNLFLQSLEDNASSENATSSSKEGCNDNSPMMAQSEQSEVEPESPSIEQLIQLYSLNREHYLKVLQQANSEQESAESIELATMTRKLI